VSRNVNALHRSAADRGAPNATQDHRDRERPRSLRVTREEKSGATPWPGGVRVALPRDFSYDFQAGASWKNLGNLKAGALLYGRATG
jgi:hypothetical protein